MPEHVSNHRLPDHERPVRAYKGRCVAHYRGRLLPQEDMAAFLVLGKQSHGGVEISLSREELAQMTGTTLFTISRILSRWSEEGFVLPRREAVLVRDAERLTQVGSEEY